MGDLRVRLLGGFEVEGIEALALGSRKARTLLKVLALARGRPVSADRLASCLWPDTLPARPGEQVRVLVSRLRGVLGADRLPRTDAGYALMVDWLDVDALAELVEEAGRRMEAGSPTSARAAGAAADALARGSLLPEEADAPWAVVERAAADRLMAAARQLGAQAALAVGDLTGAARLAEGALDLDPYDEVVLRTLMVALAASGRPASALAAYAAVRARLADDLGVDPAPGTEALHTAILLDRPLPGMPAGLAPPGPAPAAPAPAPTVPADRADPAPTAGAGTAPTSAGAGRAATAGPADLDAGETNAAPPDLDAAETNATPAAPHLPEQADRSDLPGRADALALLDSSLREAATGHGGLVVVEGEAGMGKSRILSTWSPRAAAVGATVLLARCDELTRGLPLQAVLDALDDHLRSVGPAGADRLLDSEAEVLGPLLGRPAAPTTHPPLAGQGDQAGGQQQVFAALLAVLSRGPGPTVLLIDDVHLAGTSTVEWLHYVARRADRLPLLLVVTQRPEEAARLPPAPTVTLAPLDEEDAARLVGPARAPELVARSGGNPLFLVELAAADPAGGLPATVRDAVLARCERAGPAAATTLRTAAIIGAHIDLDLLAAVLRAPPVELLDHLEQGLRLGLLREQPAGFAFRHELFRDALDAAASSSRRSVIHREVSRALAARPRPDSLAVAHHAELGGDPDLAARALVDAASVASTRFDQHEALRLLDRSVHLADSLAGRLLRARVLILLGFYDRATAEVDVALGLGGGAQAMELGAWAAHYRREFETAAQLADGGVRSATDDDERVGCLVIGGWVRQCMGDLPAAESRLEEADRLGTGVWRPVSEVWLGGLRVHQGRCEEGVELVRPATSRAAAAAHGYPALHAYPVLHARLFQALGLGHLGRAAEALEAVAALDREAESMAAGRWAGRADNTRGWILRGLGAWSEADDANRLGLERSSAAGMREPMSHAHLDLAAGALIAGDLDRATAEVAAAYDLGDGHALAWRHRLRGHLYLGEIALAAGDADVAGQMAAEVGVEAGAIGTARYTTLSGILAARARLAAGEAVDLDRTDRLLADLPAVAGMEAWRLTAAVAAAAGVERWWTLAATRVAALAGRAGVYAPSLERAAGTTLDSMRTVSRNG